MSLGDSMWVLLLYFMSTTVFSRVREKIVPRQKVNEQRSIYRNKTKHNFLKN